MAAYVAEDAVPPMAGEAGEVDWAFDEEQVARERQESLARTQKAKELVEAQGAVLQGILKKMVEGEEDGIPLPSAGSGHHGRIWSNASTSSWSLQEGSSTFEQQAYTVAEQIVARQEKTDAFSKRRREKIEKANIKTEMRKAAMEEAEARFAERQREIAEESRRRAFASQQRRNEQQKVRKENQREMDRICDEYYKEQSPRGHRGGSTSPGTSPRGRRRGQQEQTVSAAEQDIYRHIVQSHGLYSETVDRWRSQVAENDSRSEAFRRRVLKAARSGSRQREDKPKAAGLLRRKMSSLSILKREATQASLASAGSDHSATAGDAAGSPEATFGLSKGSSSTGALTPASPSSTALWHQRWLKVKEYASEQDRRMMEKQGRDEALLQAGRNRIAAINKDVVMRAEERARQWRERNDAATARRKKNEVRSDAEMTAKMEDFARRRRELEESHAQERADMGENKKNMIQSAQAAAQLLLDRAEEAFYSKTKERDELLAERYSNKLQDFIKKSESGGPYYEMAALAKSRKKEFEEEFRRKAMTEVEMKKNRHIGVLSDINAPALDKQRTLKKSRWGTPMHSPSSTGMLPDLPFKLTPADLEDDHDGPARVLSEALAEAPKMTRLKSPGKQSPTSSSAHGSAAFGGGEGDVTRSRRPSQASMLSLGDDDGVEGELLQDLEKRSSNWMKEMRKKKAQSVTKF